MQIEMNSCSPLHTMCWRFEGRVQLVCRFLENRSWKLVAIGIDDMDLNGPCALGVTFDPGRLIALGCTSESKALMFGEAHMTCCSVVILIWRETLFCDGR